MKSASEAQLHPRNSRFLETQLPMSSYSSENLHEAVIQFSSGSRSQVVVFSSSNPPRQSPQWHSLLALWAVFQSSVSLISTVHVFLVNRNDQSLREMYLPRFRCFFRNRALGRTFLQLVWQFPQALGHNVSFAVACWCQTRQGRHLSTTV